MLWTVFVVLMILWLLGFSLHIGGGLIHLLLVIGLVVLVINYAATDEPPFEASPFDCKAPGVPRVPPRAFIFESRPPGPLSVKPNPWCAKQPASLQAHAEVPLI